MSYSQFTVEDFLLDKKFRRWILSPDAESNRFWQLWLQQHPGKKAILQEARTIILKTPSIKYKWSNELEDSLWQSIIEDIEDTQRLDEANTKIFPLHSAAVLGTSTNQLHHKRNYKVVGMIAATILLILIFGAVGYLSYHENDKIQPTIAYVLKTAPLGTKARFDLPDGSHVVMNAGSAIRYPESFPRGERLIAIEGEVYLEVAKDSLRPFRVKTGTVVTEALGTAFNVIHEERRVEISLVEGKVQVNLNSPNAQDEKLILAPGQQASLQNGEGLIKGVFDVDEVTAWTQGIIFFKGAGEQEVVTTLERWYGVNITIEGQSSKTWNFLGSFKDKSLRYVLESVGYTMNFHFTIEGDNVKIIYL